MKKQLLKQHQKADIRFQEGDFVFYEPTKEQLAKIKALVQQKVQLTEDINIEGEIAFESVRFIIRELTNIGDEIDNYTDVELQKLLDNGDKQIQLLLKNITELINEITDDIFDDYIQQVKIVKNYLKIIKNHTDVEQIKNEINKLFQYNNINLTVDDLSKIESKDKQIVSELVQKMNHKTEKKK